jgi:hypothetical protein
MWMISISPEPVAARLAAAWLDPLCGGWHANPMHGCRSLLIPGLTRLHRRRCTTKSPAMKTEQDFFVRYGLLGTFRRVPC